MTIGTQKVPFSQRYIRDHRLVTVRGHARFTPPPSRPAPPLPPASPHPRPPQLPQRLRGDGSTRGRDDPGGGAGCCCDPAGGDRRRGETRSRYVIMVTEPDACHGT